MKAATYTLELLTPCFCAGAEQSKAEIRASAIRGQLRWWFRTLGGNAADERSIFGGVAGAASASSLIVRVQSIKPSAWQPPHFTPNDSESYVWYFASVSGTTVKGAKGPRWQSQAAHGPGTTFQIHLFQRRPLVAAIQREFDFALRAFLQLGAIGLRATRGLGTFACHEIPFDAKVLTELQNRGFYSEHRSVPLPDVHAIAREIGSLVKGTRKKLQMKAERPSPFGGSEPRQTSAIYFRPVRTANSKACTLVVFEAPHARVLGPPSNRPRVVGHSPSHLQKPDPVAPRY